MLSQMDNKKPAPSVDDDASQGRSIAVVAFTRKGQAFKSPIHPNKRTGMVTGIVSLRLRWRTMRDCYHWDSIIADPVSESRKGDRAGYGWSDKKPATCGSRIVHKASVRRLAPKACSGWLCHRTLMGHIVPRVRG